MRYREVPPPAVLAPWVRCLWLLEDRGAQDGAGPVERIVPDGCVELIVHYGTPMRRCADPGTSPGARGAGHGAPDGGEHDGSPDARGASQGAPGGVPRTSAPEAETQPRSIVAGQLRGATDLLPAGPIGMVAARLHPWAAASFVREPVDALTGRIVPLDALWARAAGPLEERVAAATGDEARWQVLVDALAAHLAPADETTRALQTAVRWIAGSRGTIGVEPLARRLGWSRRRLERRFAAGVGLPPKALCRIERFQHVVRALGSPRPPRLVELALAAGYADQAHLARDFRDLAGTTATAWMAGRHALSDHLTGAAAD